MATGYYTLGGVSVATGASTLTATTYQVPGAASEPINFANLVGVDGAEGTPAGFGLLGPAGQVALVRHANDATTLQLARPWAGAPIDNGSAELILGINALPIGRLATLITQIMAQRPLTKANNLSEFLGDATAQAAVRNNIGAQAANENLAALAGLTLAANKLPYANGDGSLALADLTTLARSVLAATSSDDVRRIYATPRFDAVGKSININPLMLVHQDFVGTASAPTGTHITDNHAVAYAGTMAIDGEYQGPPGGYPNPLGRVLPATHRVKVMTAQASLGATDALLPYNEWLEGTLINPLRWGSAAARGIDIITILRPLVPSDGNAQITAALSVRNFNGGALDRSYVSLLPTYTSNSFRGWLTRIPGDSTGTWSVDTGRGMVISICTGCGTTSRTTTLDAWTAGNFVSHASVSNLAALSGNMFDVCVVLALPAGMLGLPPGEIDISLWDKIVGIARPFDDELMRCKRYFERQGYVAISSGVGAPMAWEVEKRTTPTFSATFSSGTGAIFGSLSGAPTKAFTQGTLHSTNSHAVVTGNARL